MPFCQASNFAPGVNLTFKLAEAAAKALGDDSADIEIVEAHHRHKLMRPRARRSAWERWLPRLGVIFPNVAVYGREGRTGARDRDDDWIQHDSRR
jgi:4-hydroxy-tetrahydrodipicolinate reductase